MVSAQESPTLCYWIDHIWPTWDHWQFICSWRYELRKAAYIFYYSGMLFLLRYCPNHRARESGDTASRNNPVLYRAKTRGWFICVVRIDPAPGFQALANDPILKSHRISIELGRFKNKNPCHRTCSPKRPRTYTEKWPHCKSGILSAINACCCICQQFDSAMRFVCKRGAYSKGPVYKSTIAYIGPGAHIIETSMQARQQWEI